MQTGRDPSQWFVIGWLWANTYYNSTETFRAAWEAGELPKLEANLQGSWIGTDYQGPDTPLGANSSMWRDEVPPPVSVLVGGEEGIRYKVDVEDQYVEWSTCILLVTSAELSLTATQWTSRSMSVSRVTVAFAFSTSSTVASVLSTRLDWRRQLPTMRVTTPSNRERE